MTNIKRAAITMFAALGIALMSDMPVERRQPQFGHVPSKLKTGTREQLRNRKKRERKAKRKSR